MTTLICATHRPQNQTQRIVNYYQQLLEESHEEVQRLDMSDFPRDFPYADSFGERSQTTDDLLRKKILPASRLVIIAPEYNGSFPGIFKTFLDGVDPRIWKGKKVALVGVAAGRAGNLRGMDHLTDVLHYLRMEVFSLKVPISKLQDILSQDGELQDLETRQVLKQQARDFLLF